MNIKEKFIKSTIILVIGGLITKILGMVIRIIMTRVVGLKGIGLYMLIVPTFNLFITIATMSLPIAISKIIAEDKKNNRKLVFGIIPIAMFFNIILILIIILIAPFIANTLLKNNDLLYPILAIGITLPFITISSIIRGYFFGKERMFPHVLSNIIEQIIRILGIIVIIPKLLNNDINLAITGLVLLNCISEFASIIILLFFLPKKIKIKRTDIKPDLSYIKDIFFISIPTTLGRLISSIGMFLEPIILTYILLKIGWTSSSITNEYGIISGYVLPMVMMPSFLTGAISSALLPVISKLFVNNQIKSVKRKIKQALFYSLLIGIPCTIFLIIFPELSLKLIFKTNLGTSYLRIAAPIFLLSYVLGPLNTVLQSINKSKVIMISNLIGNIIKIIVLIIFTFMNINMYSLLIAYCFQYLYILFHQIIVIKKILI